MSLTPLYIGTLAVAALSAAWVGWGFLYPPSLTLQYRQTVILDGPEGTVEMSGVFKEVARHGVSMDDAPFIFSFRVGEALGSDVPGVGYVLQSLMRRGTDLTGTVVSAACGVTPPDLDSAWGARAWLDAVDRAFVDRCELPVSASHIVVVLEDLDRPELGGAYFPDHLPHGLRIRSITLERTNSPVTSGRLPPSLWTRSVVPKYRLVPDDGSVFLLVESRFIQRE